MDKVKCVIGWGLKALFQRFCVVKSLTAPGEIVNVILVEKNFKDEITFDIVGLIMTKLDNKEDNIKRIFKDIIKLFNIF